MANSNWYGGNPVTPETPSPVARPLGWNETRNGKRHWVCASGRVFTPDHGYADSFEETETRETAAAGLDNWVADPKEERDYVRVDVSAPRLGSAVEIAAQTIGGRGYFANVDTGFSVYCGKTEQRLSVTLFEVSLCGAYGFFAMLRAKLRAAGYEVDCGRFYFTVDGRETSHCAKRVAPREFTLAAGLSLALETETEGANYGRTEVYASGPAKSSDCELA